MSLLEDLKMSLLNVNFVMIYIIHKRLELLKIHLIYLNDTIFECFFKEYNRFLFLLKSNKIFFTTYNDAGKLKS